MRRKRSKTHQAASLPRIDRRIQEHESDTDGRWVWGAPPADAHRTSCPACRRIDDNYPAGFVIAEGEFAALHRAEIVGLARNLEEREKKEHPLKRIIRVSGPEGGRSRSPRRTPTSRAASGRPFITPIKARSTTATRTRKT